MRHDTFELDTFMVQVNVCGMPYYVTDGEGSCARDKSKAFTSFTWMYAQKLKSMFKNCEVTLVGTNNDDVVRYGEDGYLIRDEATA